MITVSILINGQAIYTRTAVRVREKGGVGSYALDDGKRITHEIEDGAIALAKKMLDTIKELPR